MTALTGGSHYLKHFSQQTLMLTLQNMRSTLREYSDNKDCELCIATVPCHFSVQLFNLHRTVAVAGKLLLLDTPYCGLLQTVTGFGIPFTPQKRRSPLLAPTGHHKLCGQLGGSSVAQEQV